MRASRRGACEPAARAGTPQSTKRRGAPARFEKDGEPGRKITCQECHGLKVTAAEAAGEPEEPVQTQKKGTKKRKLPPKARRGHTHTACTQPNWRGARRAQLTPEMLCDANKGITAMYRAFPNVRYRGRGHEARAPRLAAPGSALAPTPCRPGARWPTSAGCSTSTASGATPSSPRWSSAT